MAARRILAHRDRRETTDPNDARLVRLQLTEEGRMKLVGLASQHLREVERLAVDMSRLWVGLG